MDERDGNGLGAGNNAKVKQVFAIDLTNAVDITNLSGAQAAAAAVGKKLFVDIVALLTPNPAYGFTPATIPSKIEGLAFGPDELVNGVTEHTLWVSNDNDFDPNNSGPNRFFVIGFQDSDLPQTPLPASVVLFGSALLGLFGLLRPRRPMPSGLG